MMRSHSLTSLVCCMSHNFQIRVRLTVEDGEHACRIGPLLVPRELLADSNLG